jgi:hypothetical protein
MNDSNPKFDVLNRLELYFSTRQFNRVLRQYYDVLNNDYDAVMIFLIVAEFGFRSIIHLAAVEADYRRMEQIYLEEGSLGISMLAIGEASGIPRETVRRKVKWLTDSKYLAVHDNSKNIYLPLSAIANEKLSGVLMAHSSEAVHLVKTLQLYTKAAV